MIVAATKASKLLVMLKDPTGRKRAQARRRLLMMGGSAAAGSLLAIAVGIVERHRRRRQSQIDDPATQARAAVRTAGTADAEGRYRSRHGVGAGPVAGTSSGPIPMRTGAPIDRLVASAERLQKWGGDEPGFRAHLGFGVGGSIPGDAHTRGAIKKTGRDVTGARATEPDTDSRIVGASMPTAGGDALGGTVRGGDDVGYADEIVTGAGEAISNSTTPAQNGHGSLH